jgi:hypothetical protein
VASITPELNWSGTYTYRTRQVHTPRTLDELRRLIDTASGSLHGLGTRHSFNDIADADGLISAARRARSVVRPPLPLPDRVHSEHWRRDPKRVPDRPSVRRLSDRHVAWARARHRTRRQERRDPYCRRRRTLAQSRLSAERVRCAFHLATRYCRGDGARREHRGSSAAVSSAAALGLRSSATATGGRALSAARRFPQACRGLRGAFRNACLSRTIVA